MSQCWVMLLKLMIQNKEKLKNTYLVQWFPLKVPKNSNCRKIAQKGMSLPFEHQVLRQLEVSADSFFSGSSWIGPETSSLRRDRPQWPNTKLISFWFNLTQISNKSLILFKYLNSIKLKLWIQFKYQINCQEMSYYLSQLLSCFIISGV